VTFLVRSGTTEKVHLVGSPAGTRVPYASEIDAWERTSRRAHRENLPTAVHRLANEQISRGPDRRASGQTVDDVTKATPRRGGPDSRSERPLQISSTIPGLSRRLIQLHVEITLHTDTQTRASHRQPWAKERPRACGSRACFPFARSPFCRRRLRELTATYVVRQIVTQTSSTMALVPAPYNQFR